MTLIVLVCLMVLGILFFRRRIELILNFLLRGIFGGILIYLANETLLFFDCGLHVGINIPSLLTCATLGFPGVFLLYGMMLL